MVPMRKEGMNASVAACPGGPDRSYYTDPTPNGACQSYSWNLLAVLCDNVSGSDDGRGGNDATWKYSKTTRFLAVASKAAPNKCLAAVPPRTTNSVAASVMLTPLTHDAIIRQPLPARPLQYTQPQQQ